MRVCSDRKRRSRYLPDATHAPQALTPRKLGYLLRIAECGVIALPQLARLSHEALKATTRQMRGLVDLGAVSVIALPRAAVSDLHTANDARLLGGSAPNLYRLTALGAKLLRAADLADPQVLSAYGPKNTLFLAHHLETLDMLVWLEQMAYARPGEHLERWTMGEAAAIALGPHATPKAVKPDAWFSYRLPQGVLVGLVEVDRGTERGGKRWQNKIAAYTALMRSTRLQETTGYRNARLLVIVPTEARRTSLSAFLAEHAPPDLQGRCWLAARSVLTLPDLTQALWQQPGNQILRPLITPPDTQR